MADTSARASSLLQADARAARREEGASEAARLAPAPLHVAEWCPGILASGDPGTRHPTNSF